MSFGIDCGTSISSCLSSTPRSAEQLEECTYFSVSNMLSIGWFRQLCCASFGCLGITRVHAHILLAFNGQPSTNYSYYVGDHVSLCLYPLTTTAVTTSEAPALIQEWFMHMPGRRTDNNSRAAIMLCLRWAMRATCIGTEGKDVVLIEW